MATKSEKLNRISSDAISMAPLPEWPKLPAFLKERFPDHAEAIDDYNAKCLEFFKKTGTING